MYSAQRAQACVQFGLYLLRLASLSGRTIDGFRLSRGRSTAGRWLIVWLEENDGVAFAGRRQNASLGGQTASGGAGHHGGVVDIVVVQRTARRWRCRARLVVGRIQNVQFVIANIGNIMQMFLGSIDAKKSFRCAGWITEKVLELRRAFKNLD